MIDSRPSSVEQRWARLGVLFNCAPADRSPDIERLLVDTARAVAHNARLHTLSVTWLRQFSGFVAHHRLAYAIHTSLAATEQSPLGLILEEAVANGASAELLVASAACSPSSHPRPLSQAHVALGLTGLALRNASPLSRKWGVWAPPVELKPDALRPVSWLLKNNPTLRDRIIRKGDLRCSLLETLRRDCGGWAASESELTRLSGATRTAVRKALAALVLEGEVVVGPEAGNKRDHTIRLTGG